MKKLLLAAAFLLGCFFQKAVAQAVSAAEAEAVAQHFFAAQSQKTSVKMRLIGDPKKSFSKNWPSRKSSFYLFEPTEGKGFVAVSAEKAAAPILGYSTENSFRIADLPENLNGFLTEYATQIEAIAAQKIKANADQKAAWAKWADPASAVAENYALGTFLVRTTWDQGQFYNDQCPTDGMGNRALTGCVATAMAQIINYWEWSDGDDDWFEYEDDESDVQGDFGSWIGGQYSWGLPAALASPNWTVAKLMFDCGVSVEMDYGTGFSGALTADCVDAYEEFFGFVEGDWREREDFTTAEWMAMLKHEFHGGRPVHYRGEGSGGHSWVCDGYDANNFFHMNWGWSGAADGFWNIDGLMPNGNNLTREHAAIFELRPRGCATSHFSTGVEFGSHERRLWIEANSTIFPLVPVTFDAGRDITFFPGFTAPAGCHFSAIIDGCDGNFDAKSEAADRAEKGEKEAKTTENEAFSLDLAIAPNPFSDFAKLSFEMPEAGEASIQIFNSTGQKMAEPMPKKWLEAGPQTVDLEAVGLQSGAYFLVLQTSKKRVSRPAIVVD